MIWYMVNIGGGAFLREKRYLESQTLVKFEPYVLAENVTLLR